MKTYTLSIVRDGVKCGSCPFLESNYFDRTGDCLLFNSRLNCVRKYGEVDGWYVCDKCKTVTDRSTASD